MNLKSLLKSLKLNESTISMILGAIVIVVVGVLVINYFKSADEGITIPAVDIENLSLPTTHIVSEGEELWGISEKYYGTGYNWTDIAKENNLSSPYTIEVGQELAIPTTALEETSEPELLSGHDEKYIAEKGDTLWSISEKLYGTGYEWVSIAQANNIKPPYKVEKGQVLNVPGSQAVVGTETAIESDDEQGAISATTYTVEKGDHLWGIAVRAYGDGYKWTEIAKENNLTNPNIIHSGNTLTLPR